MGSGGREDVGRPARAQKSFHTPYISAYTPDKSGSRVGPANMSCTEALISRSYRLLMDRRRAKMFSIHLGSYPGGPWAAPPHVDAVSDVELFARFL